MEQPELTELLSQLICRGIRERAAETPGISPAAAASRRRVTLLIALKQPAITSAYCIYFTRTTAPPMLLRLLCFIAA